ncbi:MAG: hypothetical protein ABIE74_07240 [Pseudomonadota bacterium]
MGTLERHKVLAAMIVKGKVDDYTPLVDALSPEEKNPVKEYIKELMNESDARYAALAEIKKLKAKRDFRDLEKVHPGWILYALRDESPRVIGIILRYLPSRQVRYIVQNLPPKTRESLPHMVESFAVPSEVLELVKKKFMERFSFLSPAVSGTIANLTAVDGEGVMSIVKELGIMELGFALSGLSKPSMKILYNRLKLKDAKKLRQRIVGFEDDSALRREARFALLDMNLKEEGEEELILEMGLNFLSRAILKGDSSSVDVISQKLPPQFGYKFKRKVTENSVSVNEENVKKRLKIVSKLLSDMRNDLVMELSDDEDTASFISETVNSLQFTVKTIRYNIEKL